jgi:thioesterase III
MAHEISIHVYPTDCDMLGHVNHATMITFLEHARWALLERELVHGPRTTGGATNVWEAFRSMGVFTVVRHVDISYHAQVLPGDDIVIRSGLVSVGRTSFVVRQDVLTARGGAPAAEAKIAFVCVGPDSRPVPVPDAWRDVFPRWENPA